MQKSLKLFSAVLAKNTDFKPTFTSDGIVIAPNAMWAKDAILNFIAENRLNGIQLNKTFHKSWDVIKNSSRYQLAVEQISHYLSTYGTNFESEVYIPDEVLDLPDVKLVYKVIKGFTKEELIEKCLNLLQSGVALKQDTIEDIFICLHDELNCLFTGKENIKNKEAIIKLADIYQPIRTCFLGMW